MYVSKYTKVVIVKFLISLFVELDFKNFIMANATSLWYEKFRSSLIGWIILIRFLLFLFRAPLLVLPPVEETDGNLEEEVEDLDTRYDGEACQ